MLQRDGVVMMVVKVLVMMVMMVVIPMKSISMAMTASAWSVASKTHGGILYWIVSRRGACGH
jgi:hypothetical protein